MRLSSKLAYVPGRKLRMYGLIDGEYREFVPPRPYMFSVVEPRNIDAEVEKTDLVDKITGRKVWKISAERPSLIPRLRNKIGYNNTREADVRFDVVLMKDYVLESAFSAGNVCFLDIEVWDENGFPRSDRDRIVAVSVTSYNGSDTMFFYVGNYGDSEAEMLRALTDYMMRKKYSVVVGWNIGFDAEYLLDRMKINGIDTLFYDTLQFIDLRDEYKASVKGLGIYTLLNVAKHEGLSGYEIKKKYEDKRIYQMSEKELEEYNVNDVKMLVDIERKYGFVNVLVEFANRFNVTVEHAMKPIVRSDVIILRRIRELGYVAKNVDRNKKKHGYEGAIVLQPPLPGLYRNVVEYDFDAMYPNIIRIKKIDIDGFNGEVLPHIIDRLYAERLEAKRKYKLTGDVRYDVKQKALKVAMNTLYGVFGNKHFRYFDERKAEMVTANGRKLIRGVKEFVEKNGYFVVYGDTDSLFIQNPYVDGEKLVEWARATERLLNVLIRPFSLKLEAVGDILFPAAATKKNEAPKKRYIFRTIDGNWIIRGIEIRRGDWDEFTKMVVWNVIQMIFEGKSEKEIREYLKQEKEMLYMGVYDRMLIISKGIDPEKNYKQLNAEHLRAYRKLCQRLGVDRLNIDTVMYVYAGNDVYPVLTEKDVDAIRGKLNYTRYWNRLMRSVLRYLMAITTQNAHTLEEWSRV